MRHKFVAAGLTVVIAAGACIGFTACKEENLAEIVSEQLTADQWSDAFYGRYYYGSSENFCIRWTKHVDIPVNGTIVSTVDMEYEVAYSGELAHYSGKMSATGEIAESSSYQEMPKSREMYFRYAEMNRTEGTLYTKTDDGWCVEENAYDTEIAMSTPSDTYWEPRYDDFIYDVSRGGYVLTYEDALIKQTTLLKFRDGKIVFAVVQTENGAIPELMYYYGNTETVYSFCYGDDVPEITLPQV